jgi:Cell wall-associated hydrolases (invasion-associated proteins)
MLVACITATAPIRKDPSHPSEMVSELLLGEFAEVLETSKDFLKIRCLYDGYEGWCQRKQLTEVPEALFTNLFLGKGMSVARVNGRDCRISCGTPVYATDELVALGKYTIQYPSKYAVDIASLEFNELNIEHITHQFLGTPYLWGGKSAMGIDCSGFTQQVFKLFGVFLPRDAYQQAEIGDTIGFLEETSCGDLAFFDNEEGRITHVGILLNSDTIIHSSGSVRIDKIDHAGIVNVDTNERTHSLRLIKRMMT